MKPKYFSLLEKMLLWKSRQRNHSYTCWIYPDTNVILSTLHSCQLSRNVDTIGPNIQWVEQPEDKDITRDILEENVDEDLF